MVDDDLDPSTEQELLSVDADRGICCHAGGAIDFDAEGNLYLSTGDDSNPFASDGFAPARRARHPQPGVRRPAQLGQHQRPARQGAADHARPARRRTRSRTATCSGGARHRPKTRPRSTRWASATRSGSRSTSAPATSTSVSTARTPAARTRTAARAASWSSTRSARPATSAGPTAPAQHRRAYNEWDFATGTSGPQFDCAAPVNNSPHNTGLTDLPPAQPAWITYDGGKSPTGVTTRVRRRRRGPDGRSGLQLRPGPGVGRKFPEYYDNKIFACEWTRGWIRDVVDGRRGRRGRHRPVLRVLDLYAADGHGVRPGRLAVRPGLRQRRLVQRQRELRPCTGSTDHQGRRTPSASASRRQTPAPPR